MRQPTNWPIGGHQAIHWKRFRSSHTQDSYARGSNVTPTKASKYNQFDRDISTKAAIAFGVRLLWANGTWCDREICRKLSTKSHQKDSLAIGQWNQLLPFAKRLYPLVNKQHDTWTDTNWNLMNKPKPKPKHTHTHLLSVYIVILNQKTFLSTSWVWLNYVTLVLREISRDNLEISS